MLLSQQAERYLLSVMDAVEKEKERLGIKDSDKKEDAVCFLDSVSWLVWCNHCSFGMIAAGNYKVKCFASF